MVCWVLRMVEELVTVEINYSILFRIFWFCLINEMMLFASMVTDVLLGQ